MDFSRWRVLTRLQVGAGPEGDGIYVCFSKILQCIMNKLCICDRARAFTDRVSAVSGRSYGTAAKKRVSLKTALPAVCDDTNNLYFKVGTKEYSAFVLARLQLDGQMLAVFYVGRISEFVDSYHG